MLFRGSERFNLPLAILDTVTSKIIFLIPDSIKGEVHTISLKSHYKA